MNTPPNHPPNCVQVIPSCPCSRDVLNERITIHRLNFWYNGSYTHPVTEITIQAFLRHTQLYGATMFLQSPQLGCFSLNGDPHYQNGEVTVAQIIYLGEVIYTH
jgi:hypothetical protein